LELQKTKDRLEVEYLEESKKKEEDRIKVKIEALSLVTFYSRTFV
jgi:hypothetical protein